MLSEKIYKDILIKAGLTIKQANIYIACLQLGQAKAPDIAKKSGIKRSTVYGILDELTGLGLVGISRSGKIQYYKAQDPRTISEILDERKQAVEHILPGLSDLFADHNVRPNVQFFYGKEAVKRVYEDSLRSKYKKIYQIVKVNEFTNFPSESYSKEYIQRRAAKGITAHAIHPISNDRQDELYGKTSTKWKRIVRYANPDIFHTSMVMIYDHKVAMISTQEEGFGFIIESKEFSKTLLAYFNFIWDHSKS